jgi:hypothetical protein
MQLRSLNHLLEVVRAVARPEEIDVLGSSSLLGSDPTLGDPGQPLELSMDADLLLVPCDDRMAAVVHEAVGEGSLFHREFGVFADLLKPDIEVTLPSGWRTRRVPLPGSHDVLCLHPADLAVVKLCLGRPKDMDLLAAMIRRGLVAVIYLRAWYQSAVLSEREPFAVSRRLAELDRSA